MELLLQIEKYSNTINENGLSKKDIEQIKSELDFEGIEKISEKNIGPGNDIFVILASIITIANVFMLGDKIDKGIEGWIKIGQRIKNIFKNKELVSVDKDGANLLAIELISNYENISTFEKTSEQEIVLVDFSAPHLFGDNRTSDDLISKPYRYFIFSFLINDEKTYVIGVRSDGETNLIKCFDSLSTYGINEIKTQHNTI